MITSGFVYDVLYQRKSCIFIFTIFTLYLHNIFKTSHVKFKPIKNK
jgi:hypothetical protein